MGFSPGYIAPRCGGQRGESAWWLQSSAEWHGRGNFLIMLEIPYKQRVFLMFCSVFLSLNLNLDGYSRTV